MRRAVIALAAFMGSIAVVIGVTFGTAAAQDGAQGVEGTLASDGQPAEGVTINVTNEAGEPVGAATSDAAGAWRVPVPAPGQYGVMLDTATLPEGIGLVDDAPDTQLTQVFAGSFRAITFRLGPAQQAAEEALAGTLTSEGEPLGGVTVTVETPDGQEVGTATSDGEGRWRVDVPEPGEYSVSIDLDTVPEGIGLINEDQETLTVRVFAGNVRTVLFRLAPGGEGVGGASGRLDRIPQLLFEGLNLGLIIALAAVGLSLIYGTTGLTNFSHGELVTFGALVAIWLNTMEPHINLVFAAAGAVLASGVFGYVQDRWFWGWLRHRGAGIIAMMIVSIGFALFLRNIYLIIYGGRTRQFTDYNAQVGIDFGPFTANYKTLTGMGVCAAVIVAIGLALLFTRLGKATRAVADNPSLAAASGIDVQRVIRTVWTLGAAAAGLAGIVLGMSQGIRYTMGFQILLLTFAGVTLGGLGTAFGALVGSLVVGLFIQLSTLYVAEELKIASALLVMILVLLVRPQGILGRRERVG